jgi:two-component system, cell cycle response regulator DivK
MAKKGNYPQTIMVVDDSDDIRELLRDVLSSEGYNVVETKNGARCGRDCQVSMSRHLTLMDLSMPVLDGYAATRQIREAAEICDIPIVACSAYTSSDHLRQRIY